LERGRQSPGELGAEARSGRVSAVPVRYIYRRGIPRLALLLCSCSVFGARPVRDGAKAAQGMALGQKETVGSCVDASVVVLALLNSKIPIFPFLSFPCALLHGFGNDA
jgi:hypothetical protein